MTEQPPLLSVTNLSKAFGGVQALRGVDFEMGAGEIRCLAGENGSGKSTFVKILSGVHTPDEGQVLIDGEEATHLSTREASAAGIQVIYQDLSLFPHLSVAENIAMNRILHGDAKTVSAKDMQKIAREQLERIHLQLPLDARVSSLSAANRQIVAICRALTMDAKLLFMDEPTTALTSREVEGLLEIMLKLKDSGLSTIFISHKLDEVFKVADTITIFRDGSKVGDFSAADLDEASLSRHMTGRDIIYARYHRRRTEDEPLLETRNLTREGNYRDMNLVVRPGDIVGLTGLLGAGRTELALSLFGLNEPDSGEIRIKGKVVHIDAPWDAMRYGIALLPEDRHSQGLFGDKSVRANVSATMFGKVVNQFKVLSPKREHDLATQVITDLRVNNRNPNLEVSKLSGGNQQKVVIGKWIFRNPSVFILDSPTVGIDIGSKSEIYDRIHELAEDGMGVILISDEPEEIVVNCNRIVVMHEGVVLQEFDESDVAVPDFKDKLIALIENPDRLVQTHRSGSTEAGR